MDSQASFPVPSNLEGQSSNRSIIASTRSKKHMWFVLERCLTLTAVEFSSADMPCTDAHLMTTSFQSCDIFRSTSSHVKLAMCPRTGGERSYFAMQDMTSPPMCDATCLCKMEESSPLSDSAHPRPSLKLRFRLSFLWSGVYFRRWRARKHARDH